MNGIKGIGFELKDGSDYEGPFPILTGQTIDLDTIQAIDYYLSLIHIYKELKTLNEDGEIGLARLFSIWANMMCAPGAATIVGCRPITMLSELLAQVHAYITVHPLYDPEGLALYVELHHMMDAILMGDWFE